MTIQTRKLRAALEVIATLCDEIDDKMPVRVARAFLSAALRCAVDGEARIADVAADVRSNPGAISRDLLALGPWRRTREADGSRDPGHKLLMERSDIRDLRRKTYTLSPKGKELISKLLEAV